MGAQARGIGGLFLGFAYNVGSIPTQASPPGLRVSRPTNRAVDESGKAKKLADGSGDQPVNDAYLRGEFPPPGRARAPRPGNTSLDLYQNAFSAFIQAVEQLDQK